MALQVQMVYLAHACFPDLHRPFLLLCNLRAAAASAAAPSCHAARLLKANRFANEDDPSGYSAYTAARAIDPVAPTTPLGARNGNTPEAAESLSNNRWLGESLLCTTSNNYCCKLCCFLKGLAQRSRCTVSYAVPSAV